MDVSKEAPAELSVVGQSVVTEELTSSSTCCICSAPPAEVSERNVQVLEYIDSWSLTQRSLLKSPLSAMR